MSTPLDVLIPAPTCKIQSKGTCSALKTLCAFMSQKKVYFSELKDVFKDKIFESSFPINILASIEVNISEAECN